MSNHSGRRLLLARVAWAAGVAGLMPLGRARARTYGNMAKTAVGYQMVPHGNQVCGNCALFEPPSSAAGAQGHCKAVAGVIQASGWCQIWAPDTGIHQS